MTNHRDSAARAADMKSELYDLSLHIDRLYEKYHDLWEAVNNVYEQLEENSLPPLPLKYK